MPLTPSPWARWKRSTPARVIGPKIPSAATPTWRWIAATAGPTSPKRRSCVRPPVAGASEEGAGAGAAGGGGGGVERGGGGVGPARAALAAAAGEGRHHRRGEHRGADGQRRPLAALAVAAV